DPRQRNDDGRVCRRHYGSGGLRGGPDGRRQERCGPDGPDHDHHDRTELGELTMAVERERGESGMVSAELAVGLVTLLLVLSLMLGVVRIGLDRAAAVSAAGAVAREAARGGDIA